MILQLQSHSVLHYDTVLDIQSVKPERLWYDVHIVMIMKMEDTILILGQILLARLFGIFLKHNLNVLSSGGHFFFFWCLIAVLLYIGNVNLALIY